MNTITIAIPTYGRDQVLVDSIAHVLPILPADGELLIIDQTPEHEAAVEQALSEWDANGRIRWIRLSSPSITGAMNRALSDASKDLVLFLDDDIIPDKQLFEAHLRAHAERKGDLVAGRVIQPWQEGHDFSKDEHFHFASLKPRKISEFMGGNFSLSRALALELGGFDENFVRVAYNFEAEFAHRLTQSGYSIYYAPDAMIHHLKASAGGTRSFGEHLTTTRPDHAIGAYYFIMRTKAGIDRAASISRRMVRSIATRHHLRRPWWIPMTLIAELRGLAWAGKLYNEGPRLLNRKRQG